MKLASSILFATGLILATKAMAIDIPLEGITNKIDFMVPSNKVSEDNCIVSFESEVESSDPDYSPERLNGGYFAHMKKDTKAQDEYKIQLKMNYMKDGSLKSGNVLNITYKATLDEQKKVLKTIGAHAQLIDKAYGKRYCEEVEETASESSGSSSSQGSGSNSSRR